MFFRINEPVQLLVAPHRATRIPRTTKPHGPQRRHKFFSHEKRASAELVTGDWKGQCANLVGGRCSCPRYPFALQLFPTPSRCDRKSSTKSARSRCTAGDGLKSLCWRRPSVT
jgi:hypothetical protein